MFLNYLINKFPNVLNLLLSLCKIKLEIRYLINLTNEIAIISEVLQINESDLSKKLSVSLETINNWKFGRKGIGLAATNLGFQYVLKTNKALANTNLLKEMFVCQKEKAYCLDDRVTLTNNGSQKVKIARIQYKNKGRYIEEILR